MYLETIKRLRGLLPQGLHVGGSYALKKFFYNTEFIVPGDLDFFYYGSRPMERWAFLNTLASIQYHIIKAGLSYDGKYKIEGQYWFFKLQDKVTGVIFDLIFIHDYKVYESLGSALAGVQYEVGYGEDPLSLADLKPLRHSASVLRNESRCWVYKSKNTNSQLEKIKQRCEVLNIELDFID